MKRFLLFSFLFLLLAAGAGGYALYRIVEEENARRVELDSPVVLEIQPGEGLRRIAARLREKGLIGNERVFLYMAWRRGIDRRIRHGRHELEGTVTMATVLDELGRTPKPILRVTIPEGRTLREIAALLEAAGVVSASSYVAVACSEELRRIVDAPAGSPCAEGYLFPDTYDLVPGISPGEIIELQLRRFRQVVDPLLARPAAAEQARLLGGEGAGRLGPLLTLASIVEKETGQAVERPRIASVFYNRLRIGMPLQTDPTVIYGVIDSGQPWDGNLTRAHLQTATPYNTYMKKGLPPGPICNPGRASLEAVLDPPVTKDLYFVARGDGFHEFSASLDDHNRAVRRYQLR